MTPTPGGDLIFADGFESGDFSAWSSSATDGGDLSVTTGAALVGTYGMAAVLDDNGYAARPHSLEEFRRNSSHDQGFCNRNNSNHTIFYGYKWGMFPVVRVELRNSGGNYQVRAQANADFFFASSTSWYTISDAEHYIEIVWKAASSPGANDGELTLWIDGVQKQQITNIDNDTMFIDQARLGAVAEIDTGTRGTYYFDAFESRTDGYIGPVAALPGYPVAQVGPIEGIIANLSQWVLNLLLDIWNSISALISPVSAQAKDVHAETSSVSAMVMTQTIVPDGQIWRTYYYAGSQRVAMRVQDYLGGDAVYYLLSDHLSSTTVTTDTNGN